MRSRARIWFPSLCSLLLVISLQNVWASACPSLAPQISVAASLSGAYCAFFFFCRVICQCWGMSVVRSVRESVCQWFLSRDSGKIPIWLRVADWFEVLCLRVEVVLIRGYLWWLRIPTAQLGVWWASRRTWLPDGRFAAILLFRQQLQTETDGIEPFTVNKFPLVGSSDVNIIKDPLSYGAGRMW